MAKHVAKTLVALVVLLAMVAPPASADVSVGVVVDDVSLGEALFIGAVGSFFGLDTKVVVGCRQRQRLSFSHIVAMMYLARLAGCDHSRVAALRSRGHGWGRIANDLGIHPGTFNKMRKGLNPAAVGDKAFEECALIWFVAAYHGASQNDVRHWKGRGHSVPSIFIALDFSSKCHKPPADLLAHRGKAKSWHAVGTAVGLSGAQIKHPGKPRGGKEFRGNSAKAGQSPSPGNGKGAAGKASPPHGPGQGAGKGKGKHN
ncbi:MAG: hypothetical protein PVH68_16630 [Armatimonadota bacterium]